MGLRRQQERSVGPTALNSGLRAPRERPTRRMAMAWGGGQEESLWEARPREECSAGPRTNLNGLRPPQEHMDRGGCSPPEQEEEPRPGRPPEGHTERKRTPRRSRPTGATSTEWAWETPVKVAQAAWRRGYSEPPRAYRLRCTHREGKDHHRAAEDQLLDPGG
mmetsp:Transcript_34821/g.74170  ORF Transcript_34821/g.74170 Transcript_34821/m.74170 type:complete len:163 (-) Transcript_34821:310-798(-)